MPRRAAHAAAPTTMSALDELLVAEQEAAARLAEADREAATLLASAKSDAGTIEREAATSLAAELAALDAGGAIEREALVRAIEDEARRTVAYYDGLAAQAIDTLAAQVITDVTGLAPEPGP